MKTVTDFIFLGSKITAVGDFSHEIKTLAPWKKGYDQPRQHIKKQRHFFANKGPSSQSYDFSSSHIWMWELDHKEGWILKNWCFWTVVFQKTLKSLLDSRRSNQSILKEISPEYSLEGWCWNWNFSTLATCCEELTHLKRPWCWERLRAGGERNDRGWDVGWLHWLDVHKFEQALELVVDREAWLAAVYDVMKGWTWLSDWTVLDWDFTNAWHQTHFLSNSIQSTFTLGSWEVPSEYISTFNLLSN